MDLSSMVNQKLVQFEYQAASKDEVIRSVGQIMAEAGIVNDKEKYIEAVFKRETECATGIGMGVAIPHCKSDAVNDAAFALIKLKNPIEWGSLDGEPVKFVIQLAAPDSADNVHLRMLSQLARDLMDDDFRDGLLCASSIEDIKKCLGNCETHS